MYYSLSRCETERLLFSISFATKPSGNHCLDYIKGVISFIAKQNKGSVNDHSYLRFAMLNSILDLSDDLESQTRRYSSAIKSQLGYFNFRFR